MLIPPHLNFIDLIKGFIPLSLSTFITSHTRSKPLTFSILSNFRDRIYYDCMAYIWVPRCSNMIDLERLCNINRREKLKSNRDTRPPSINSSYNNFLPNLALEQESIRYSIYFGISGLGFTIYDNYVLVIVV